MLEVAPYKNMHHRMTQELGALLKKQMLAPDNVEDTYLRHLALLESFFFSVIIYSYTQLLI